MLLGSVTSIPAPKKPLFSIRAGPLAVNCTRQSWKEAVMSLPSANPGPPMVGTPWKHQMPRGKVETKLGPGPPVPCVMRLVRMMAV